MCSEAAGQCTSGYRTEQRVGTTALLVPSLFALNSHGLTAPWLVHEEIRHEVSCFSAPGIDDATKLSAKPSSPVYRLYRIACLALLGS
jgi:hypothetical protein